jgi:hypothetical protein
MRRNRNLPKLQYNESNGRYSNDKTNRYNGNNQSDNLNNVTGRIYLPVNNANRVSNYNNKSIKFRCYPPPPQ